MRRYAALLCLTLGLAACDSGTNPQGQALQIIIGNLGTGTPTFSWTADADTSLNRMTVVTVNRVATPDVVAWSVTTPSVNAIHTGIAFGSAGPAGAIKEGNETTVAPGVQYRVRIAQVSGLGGSGVFPPGN